VITLVGLTVGNRVPAGLHLEFAVPLCLLTFVVTQVDDRPGLLAAGSAALVTVAGHDLPMATGLPLAIVVGIAVGSSRRAEREGSRA
jgi:predicted branched-subunit amino acid permease